MKIRDILGINETLSGIRCDIIGYKRGLLFSYTPLVYKCVIHSYVYVKTIVTYSIHMRYHDSRVNYVTLIFTNYYGIDDSLRCDYTPFLVYYHW